MNKIKSFIKENHWGMMLAFFLPLTIMIGLYASLGIYPGSDRSILASDAFSQFSNFHASFRNVMTGKQSLFYSFNAGLGLNYYALISYYLGGLFTPLVIFFDNAHMPDALYVLTLLKIATSGLTFWFFAHETFKKASNMWHVALSVAYSLMSFTLAQSEIVMWLDTFVYLPLIILGIDRLMEQRKPKLLFISYLLLFITNYYFGFMVGVFSVMYFFVKYFTQFKTMKKTIVPYFTTSILAGLSSMVMILPMYLDLKNNGETLSQITKLKTDATGIWDLVAKNMIGIYDNTRYGSIPFIYIGIIPLLLALFYFISKRINWKTKVGFGLMAIFLIASFYLEPLNLAWHGFHSPNMFLFRFSFLFSFLVILLAGYALEVMDQKNVWKVIALGFGWMILTTCFYFFHQKGSYTYIKDTNFYLTIGFLAIYMLVLILYRLKFVPQKGLATLFCVLMSGEAIINGHYMLNGILNDWNYASRSLYTAPRKDIATLVSDSEASSGETTYRLENLDPISTNDSINFGYSGISLFSSIRNRHSSELMNQLGFRARGTALNARYDNNNIMMDSLFGVRYNISKTPINKYGFTKIASAGNYSLYQNRYALPLGVKTSKAYTKIKWVPTDNLGCQEKLVNALSGLNQHFFQFVYPTIDKTENTQVTTKDGKTTFKAIDGSKPQSVIYKVIIPRYQQSYFSLFPIDFGAESKTYATVSMMGGGHRTQMTLTGQYYNLGIFEKSTELRYRLTLDGNDEVTLVTPPVISLDLKQYETAMNKLKNQAVDFKADGRHVTATVDMKDDETNIFTTIPYDNGWSLYIDGKKADIQSFRDGFITFKVPKGHHKIELSFMPQGFIIGSLLFVFGIVGFIFFDYYYEGKKRKHSSHHQ